MNTAFIDLFTKYPNHTIYTHNLGGFDSFYMIKGLYKIASIKTLFKDNNLISIEATRTIKIKNKKK